jgi:hypothetical protein
VKQQRPADADADAATRGCGGCGCGGLAWGRRAQRSSSQRRTASGRAPCRPIFFLQPALPSSLAAALLPTLDGGPSEQRREAVGVAASMRGGPSRSPLHPSVFGRGGRAMPLSHAPPRGRCRCKNAKSLLRSRWRFFAGTNADGLSTVVWEIKKGKIVMSHAP